LFFPKSSTIGCQFVGNLAELFHFSDAEISNDLLHTYKKAISLGLVSDVVSRSKLLKDFRICRQFSSVVIALTLVGLQVAKEEEAGSCYSVCFTHQPKSFA